MGGQRQSLKILGLAIAVLLLLTAILWQPLKAVIQGEGAENSPVGSMLPSLTVEDAEGKTFTLEDLARTHSPSKDPKALFLLWATWCEPCVRELPVVQENQERFGSKGYGIVLLNYDGMPKEKTTPEVKAWLVSQNVNFTSFFDFESKLIDHWTVEALPFAFATDEKGKVSWAHMGYLDWNIVELP